MGKHRGMAYLSLGIFVNHKYKYSVTDPDINDISRHFTPKLIKYLRTFVRWYSTTRNWAVVVDLRTLHSLTLKALSELYI